MIYKNLTRIFKYFTVSENEKTADRHMQNFNFLGKDTEKVQFNMFTHYKMLRCGFCINCIIISIDCIIILVNSYSYGHW